MAKKKFQPIVAPTPRIEAATEIERIILALTALQASEGWGVVRKILDDNIKYLETAILEKIDPATKEPLNDKEVDDARYRRDLNIELRDTPENYIKVVQDTGIVPQDYDPYFKTKLEIDRAQRKVPIEVH
jgi:hypothetical protein